MYVAEIKINLYGKKGKNRKKSKIGNSWEKTKKKGKNRQNRPDTPVRHAGQEVSWFRDGTDQRDAARRAREIIRLRY